MISYLIHAYPSEIMYMRFGNCFVQFFHPKRIDCLCPPVICHREPVFIYTLTGIKNSLKLFEESCYKWWSYEMYYMHKSICYPISSQFIYDSCGLLHAYQYFSFLLT